MWALKSKNPREEIKVAIDLAIDLKHGREPTMYTDLRTDPDRVQLPREVIRASAAEDSVRLAEMCLANARRHVREEEATKFTAAHDRLFTMKSRKFREMLNMEDFWWYYLSRIENDQQDIAEAVLGYERDFVAADKKFKTIEPTSS